MIRVADLVKAKNEGRKICMVTCYDYVFSKLLSKTQVDILLVGDSLAQVVHGYPSTLQADVSLMALHTAAVARGNTSKFIVADMPFLSFRKGVKETLESAGELMKAGAHAVKLEGAKGLKDSVQALVESGIPVMGHLGLTPQSVHALSGYKVQAKDQQEADELIEDAAKLQDWGVFSLVLECVPAAVAAKIQQKLRIPVIGIGAGPGVDGQVLVLHDLLGLNAEFKARFVRHFDEGDKRVTSAIEAYCRSVISGEFPSKEESF